MISKVKLFLLNILVISWLGPSSGYERCVGLFYKTSLDSYYGRYQIYTDYNHWRYHYSYRYCPDRCCTINNGYTFFSRDYSYRTCCYSYVDVTPSYTSSGKTVSTTGLIVGCTFGGTLFAVLVIFSLLVARCMYRDRKRIDPTSISNGSSPPDESIVAMADNPEDGTSFTNTTSSKAANPATEVTIT
ncbi:uncharacterized protein LOC117339666 [Pecten maximus]|uniref:uncharacterized protein LOC117339666 n=1 Tax=Pecten maximus TaxID=6579 RepID=UPI00145870DE|nr:uncharacterized protein LOC117339666 [Pecten maximus]